ncbi:hypothetical protein EYF80_035642 [Liparis tanakae]|uniref:Uncharacterized protein n=1 Tax=Liparis tanakae TaxID=230148 RepID=A0A4Z2GMW8_9TELE|nr:hypothetical protein EYF80_035642 [Liparis tanakae]
MLQIASGACSLDGSPLQCTGCYWVINKFNSPSPVFFHDVTAVLAHDAFAVCGEEIKQVLTEEDLLMKEIFLSVLNVAQVHLRAFKELQTHSGRGAEDYLEQVTVSRAIWPTQNTEVQLCLSPGDNGS